MDFETMTREQALTHLAMLTRALQGENEPDAPMYDTDKLYEIGLVYDRLTELIG